MIATGFPAQCDCPECTAPMNAKLRLTLTRHADGAASLAGEPIALPERVLELSLPYLTGRKIVPGDMREEIRSLLEVPETHAIFIMHASREMHYDLVPTHFLRPGRRQGDTPYYLA